MIEVRRFATIGAIDRGWLKAKHHFSFAEYHDATRMGWGAVRVWNDDEIAPQSGFPPHAHANMEIITYARGRDHPSGFPGKQRAHWCGRRASDAAGTGVRHSEYNLEDEPTRLFETWIEPDRARGPAWVGGETVSKG